MYLTHLKPPESPRNQHSKAQRAHNERTTHSVLPMFIKMIETCLILYFSVPPRILRGPTPTDLPTISTDTEERVQVIINGSLSLPCMVTAQPEATLVWMRDSVPLRMGDSRLEARRVATPSCLSPKL